MKHESHHYSPIAWAIGIVCVVLIIASVWGIFFRTRDTVGHQIAADVVKLAAIFKHIEATSEIIGFDNQKNPINFLTIKKDGFVGSKVGSMNIAYPERWAGPYVEKSLSVEGIDYMIVRTEHGHFITPGEGVRLPNGKVIGKDIPLDEHADIAALTRNPKALHFKGQPLAVPITIVTHVFHAFDE